jgi:glucose/arabinose dehydrogenase
VLVGGDLYVANTDALVRYPYAAGDTRITAPGTTLAELPGGPRACCRIGRQIGAPLA